MEIIILRHGPAGEREDWAKTGRPDSERPLTEAGRRRVRGAARGLAALAGAVDLVATSPWARARETAEIAAKELGAPLAVSNLLLPHRSASSLAKWLSGLKDERVVLVGHEPHLSKVVGWFLTGDERGYVALKKGQAALLDMAKAEGARAVLRWSIPAKALRRLA